MEASLGFGNWLVWRIGGKKETLTPGQLSLRSPKNSLTSRLLAQPPGVTRKFKAVIKCASSRLDHGLKNMFLGCGSDQKELESLDFGYLCDQVTSEVQASFCALAMRSCSSDIFWFQKNRHCGAALICSCLQETEAAALEHRCKQKSLRS